MNSCPYAHSTRLVTASGSSTYPTFSGACLVPGSTVPVQPTKAAKFFSLPQVTRLRTPAQITPIFPPFCLFVSLQNNRSFSTCRTLRPSSKERTAPSSAVRVSSSYSAGRRSQLAGSTLQRHRIQYSSTDSRLNHRSISGEMPVTEHELRPAELVTDHLETPSLDDRTYRVIRLPNQLEALLVHDAQTDKASAGMDVNVGNFSDERDMPGMAHAVEHVGLAPPSIALYHY